MQIFMEWLISKGMNPLLSDILGRTAACILTFFLCLFSFHFTKHKVLRFIKYIIKKSKTEFDDILVENNVFYHIPKFLPAIILINLLPYIFESFDFLVSISLKIINSYIIILISLTLNSFLTALSKMYKTFKATMKIPITALVQGVRVVLAFITVLIIIATILDRSPLIILSGFGALTAVFMLVFKDSLMGFVAGIQLTLNHMVDHGNWIEMPKYGADGNVVDITLTTVKVCNWDNTVTMVPTYALMSESFKNWQGMTESGGRRIKRSINIDMQSIKFCDVEMLKKLSKINILSDYIQSRQSQITKYNIDNKIDDNIDNTSSANGRRMTNIGIFRYYLEAYLKNNPSINRSMTFMVRQLKPSETGLPIEIYVFCKETMWVKYEAVQADMFDHIFAVINEFELEMFQIPSGTDIKQLTTLKK